MDSDPTNSATDAPRYEPVEEMYKLVLDGKGYYTIYVAGRDADDKPVWTETKVAPTTAFVNDGNGKYTVGSSGTDTVDIYTVMNVSPLKRKVILKKVADETYDEEKITLPKPELYVIYTGRNPGSKPEEISLKENFFGGADIAVDCKVKVLLDGKKGDIINQYVRFCQVFNEQVRIHGRTRKAVEETIRICQNEDVLKEYLERQREEVMDKAPQRPGHTFLGYPESIIPITGMPQ